MLTTLLTTAGLGVASGQRAALVALTLGAMHYTPYFALSADWDWLAAPIVLAVVAVVAIVEILADRYPESSELVDMASWLPKAVVGFVAVAAATGTVDGSLLELAGSGLLGASIAVGADRVRVRTRRTTRDLADSGADSADRVAHHGETLAAAGLGVAALTQPWAVFVILAALILVVGAAIAFARTVTAGALRVTGLETGEEDDAAGSGPARAER